LRGPFEKIKLLSAIYPYNSNILNIIGFNTKAAVLRNSFDGFVPLNEIMNENMLKEDPPVINQIIPGKNSAVDPNMISSLENIIHICKDKNINLFIVNSPVFHKINEINDQFPEITKISMNIIHYNNVNFWDFSDDPAFAGHIELFADKAHLNATGAKIFSNMVVARLSKTFEMELSSDVSSAVNHIIF
jgi:lysophospholipase L1-like esterase